MTDDVKHYCIREQDWGRLWEIIKHHSQHVIDGEKEGGFRDRLLIVEENHKVMKSEISTIKKGYWLAGIVGGVIGGLLGKFTPDVLNLLARALFK